METSLVTGLTVVLQDWSVPGTGTDKKTKDNHCKLPVLSKRKQLEHKGQSSPTASASVLFTGVTKALMKAQVVRKKKNNINMNQDLSWRPNSCCLSPSVSHHHHHHLFYVEEQPIRTQEC